MSERSCSELQVWLQRASVSNFQNFSNLTMELQPCKKILNSIKQAIWCLQRHLQPAHGNEKTRFPFPSSSSKFIKKYPEDLLRQRTCLSAMCLAGLSELLISRPQWTHYEQIYSALSKGTSLLFPVNYSGCYHFEINPFLFNNGFCPASYGTISLAVCTYSRILLPTFRHKTERASSSHVIISVICLQCFQVLSVLYSTSRLLLNRSHMCRKRWVLPAHEYNTINTFDIHVCQYRNVSLISLPWISTYEPY